MRVHDNPCLIKNDGKPIIPVIFTPLGDIQHQQSVLSLRNKLKKMGGNPIVIDSENSDAFNNFAKFLKNIQNKAE